MQSYNAFSTPQSSSSTSSPNQMTTPTAHNQTPNHDNGKSTPNPGFTSTTASGIPGGSSRGKRRKVAKACLACQKSHLTCDELRPCTRCLKKGMGDQCVEGVRKIAKYLLEGEDRGSSSTVANNPPSISRQQTYTASPPMHLAQLPDDRYGDVGNASEVGMVTGSIAPGGKDVWLAPPLDNGEDGEIGLPDIGVESSVFNEWSAQQGGTSGYASGSGAPPGGATQGHGFGDMYPTAAADEFQMFDAMFTSMSPMFPFLDLPVESADLGPNAQITAADLFDDMAFDNPTALPIHPGASRGLSPLEQFVSQQQQQEQRQRSQPIVSPWSITPQRPSVANEPSLNNGQDQNNRVGRMESEQNTRDTPSSHDGNARQRQEAGMGVVWAEDVVDAAAAAVDAINDVPVDNQDKVATGGTRGMTASEVYKNVTRPYDYTEGYHVLMEYLSANFQRKDVLRVVQALANYRPSLIALQMPMSEEDEVFLEKSFQRTLIELEKLISYTSTPTAVWRRTGEIVYANPEFFKLVMASEAEVLGMGGRKVYVYQILKQESVITYWENFSVHAFENTTQNFFQSVNLQLGVGVRGIVTDNGAKVEVKCSCCFTIRRDVFDLPSVVIGQFLPVQSG